MTSMIIAIKKIDMAKEGRKDYEAKNKVKERRKTGTIKNEQTNQQKYLLKKIKEVKFKKKIKEINSASNRKETKKKKMERINNVVLE